MSLPFRSFMIKAVTVAGLVAASALAPVAVGTAQASSSHSGGRCKATLPVGLSSLTVKSGGRDRLVQVYIPAKVKRSKGGAPLVLTLHGSFSTADEQLTRSQLPATADKYGFIVAAPQGDIVLAPGKFAWNVPYVTTATNPPNDEQFLLDAIGALSGAACTNSQQVFASGYSGGGRMVSALACDYPRSVAAIIPVVGLRAGAPMADNAGGFVPNAATCAPRSPVKVVAFFGTDDKVNPFAGGGAPYWGYGGLAAAQRWSELDNCRRGPASRQLSEHVTQQTYSKCRSHTSVTTYVIAGDGHTWAGSTADFGTLGHTTTEISVNEVIASLIYSHHDR